MFTRDVATQVIAPSDRGSQGWSQALSTGSRQSSRRTRATWNVPFAGIQLLLGAGLLVPCTARLVLAASIA
jgi:hypothetical protein